MELDAELLAQLYDTFQGELDDQLGVITDGLLSLEKSPTPEEAETTLHAMFRGAHNIKGAARGIEINQVADVAHALESVFAMLREHPSALTEDVVDLALQSLDVMREAMAEHRAGAMLDAARVQATCDGLAGALTASPGAEPTDPTPGSIAGAAHDIPEPAPVAADARAGAEAGPQAAAADMPADVAPAAHVAVPSAKAARGSSEAIRVGLDKLSRISVLAEDLVIAQGGLNDEYKVMQQLVGDLASARKLAGGLRRAGCDDDALSAIERMIDCLDGALRTAETNARAMRQTGRRIDVIANALQVDARMLRLVPAVSVLQPLVRSGRDIGRKLGKPVIVDVSGGDIEVDKAVIDRMRDPLMHLLRNAIDHGLESPDERKQSGKPAEGLVELSVARVGSQIHIEVRDDGRGIDPEKIVAVGVDCGLISREEAAGLTDEAIYQLMFRPGFSIKDEVSDISGRGVGLDVVQSNIQELKGKIQVSSVPGEGTCFEVTLPLTLSTERGLHVRLGTTQLVIPSSTVKRIVEIGPDDMVSLQGDHAILVDGAAVPVRELASLVDMPAGDRGGLSATPALVIQRGARAIAVLVDEIIGEHEIVLKPLRYPLVSVRNVSGATLTSQGDVVMVLSVPDLIDRATGSSYQPATEVVTATVQPTTPRVLVVDDSITTRTLERNILEIHGYDVEVATNGVEAWGLLQAQPFDLLVTDVEMPQMDGFALTERVRSDESLAELPVIIVTSLAREEEKRRGVQAGASAYIVKGTFETQILLDAVQRFV